MQLAAVIHSNWHAVQRDLIALQLRADDIGTPKLTLWELVSIVVAAHPGTAVHYKTGAWDKTSEMIANLSEQQAGVLQLSGRYPRPGVQDPQQFSRSQSHTSPAYGIPFDAMTVDELQRKRREYFARNNSPEAMVARAEAKVGQL